MRYAVVTGGTSDIGRQIAAELLRENYYVIASFCNDEKGAKDCNAYFSTISGQFSLLKVDLGDHEAIKQFGETIKSIAKSIDIFIGNAGATLRKPFTETTNEEWENIFRINLHANVYLLRDLDKLLVNEANIVFIGSSMAVYPHALSLSYGVSKAALHALSKNLVKFYQERKIRVNTVSPGFVDTKWQQNKPQEIRNNIEKKIALHQFASVQEITDAVFFCIRNNYLNGTILEIDGGYNFE